MTNRQRIDIADPAALEVARARVVDGMRASPEIIRRQCQHADRTADPVVGKTIAKKGTVAAIVLDHEEPHEEPRARHGERQAKPVADVEGFPHQHPEQNEQPGREHELDHAPNGARLAITSKDLRPRACIRHGGTARIWLMHDEQGPVALRQRVDLQEPCAPWPRRVCAKLNTFHGPNLQETLVRIGPGL
jgi:hypothetical protein